MDQIVVHLLGNPYVEVDGERVNFPYKKVEGLFYYLSVRKSATREEIVHVLWSSDSESAGRKSLREAVYQIKKMFGKDFLITNGHTTIMLNPERMPEIDWDRISKETVLEMEEGFMNHYHLKNSYEFEEWMSGMRDQYAKLVAESARDYLRLDYVRKDKNKMKKYIDLLIKQDPYNEDLYFDALRLYADNGDYNMAARLYNSLKELLRDDLDVEPSKKVTDLFQEISEKKDDIRSRQNEGEVSGNQLVGHSRELRRLNEDIQNLIKGRNLHSVAITSESGNGKTTLLEAAIKLANERGVVVVNASCYQGESEFFLRCWRDILNEIQMYKENGRLDEIDKLQHEEIFDNFFANSVYFDQSRAEHLISYQAIEKMTLDVFRTISKNHKIVLAFDDIQWMDSMSCQLLNRVLLALQPENVLLLFTYQAGAEQKVFASLDPILKKKWMDVIRMERFTEKETNDILHKYLPQLDSEESRRQEIYQMTEGNALFLMEIIKVIREKGNSWEMSLQMEQVLNSRLSLLSEAEKNILNALSIFQERASIEELSLILGDMGRLELLEHLEALKAKQVIREFLIGWNVYYGFSQSLLKGYVYRQQSLGRRQLMHRIIAEHYERTLMTNQDYSHMAMIIYHYKNCHDQMKMYEYKLRYLKGYYSIIYESFPLLYAGMDDWRKDSVSNIVKEMWQLADEIVQWNDESDEAYHLKMEVYYMVGQYEISIGEYEKGLAHIQDCIRISQMLEDVRLRIDCYKQMIFYGIQLEDMNVMREYLDLSFALLKEMNDKEEYAIMLRLEGEYLLYKEDWEQAIETFRKSIDILESNLKSSRTRVMDIAAANSYIGDALRLQGKYEESLTYYQMAIKKGSVFVVTNGLGQFYSDAGQSLFHLGRFDEARVYLTKSIECFGKYDYRWGVGRSEAYMALLELQEGHLQNAKQHLERGKALGDRIQNPRTCKILSYVQKKIQESV